MIRVASSIALASVLGVSSAASARPWLYVSGFTHSGNADTCLTAGKKALEKHGFSKELETDRYEGDSRQQGGFVEGRLANHAVVAVIECDSSEGLTTLGVSGLDNEMTYQKYKLLYDEKW